MPNYFNNFVPENYEMPNITIRNPQYLIVNFKALICKKYTR